MRVAETALLLLCCFNCILCLAVWGRLDVLRGALTGWSIRNGRPFDMAL